MTLFLMVWDLRASRAEPMLSCWHDLLFLWCLLLFYLLLPSMGWLCGVGVFGLIECSHPLPLHSGLQTKIIIIKCTLLIKSVVSRIDPMTFGTLGHHRIFYAATQGIKKGFGHLNTLSRVDQRALRWFGHVERMDRSHVAERVLMVEVSGGLERVDRC